MSASPSSIKLLAVLGIFACAARAGDVVKCPDKADVWLSSAVAEEKDSNGGKAEKMKLKIYQEFGLLDFDVSALKGKRIEKATLHVAPAGGAVVGKDRGTDLRWFTLSTVSSPWEEGEGGTYSKDEKGHGATFNEASYKTRPWTTPGSKVFDCTLGNGKSLRCDSDGGDPKDGWFTIPVDKRLVEALVAGAGYGWLIMDGSTGVYCNCYIYTRESKKFAPYLTVTLAGDDASAPTAPTNIKLVPSVTDASPSEGAGVLSFTVPDEAFAYTIKINGQELPRWQVPFAAKAGSTQTIVLEHLAPDAEQKIEIAAIDAAGNVSAFASGSGKSSPKVAVPQLPAFDWKPAGGAGATLGKVKIWAYPEGSKLDPISGKITLEEGSESAAEKNAVWDGGSSTVRIAAARGEIAAFNLALEAGEKVEDLKVEVAGLDGVQPKLWRTWFVPVKNTWQAEYAIPMKSGEALSIPAADNKVKDQKTAVVSVDLIVAESATPGEKSGTITVSGAGGSAKLNLKVQVYDATIPKEIHFAPELNCYGGPGTAGTDFFFDSFRVAHYNRCHINRVPYSQQGNIHPDWAPQVAADGHVTDWSTFDKNIGPLLDGSAFKDNPRAGVPVPYIYLPLHEHWPLPFLKYYDPGVKTKGKDWKNLHDIKAKPIEDSLPKEYADAFVRCSTDFAKHFEEKGWTKTKAECFQNNKHQYAHDGPGGTAWMMDEPNEALDWRALNWYAALFKKGVAQAGIKNAQMVTRSDVSRPQWQGSISDGLMDVMVVNSEIFSMQNLAKDHKRRMPTQLIVYGGANSQALANLDSVATLVKSYIFEGDGFVPWQALGSEDNLDHAENLENGNALIVDARKHFGLNSVASFRVHAFRQGAQICELLRLLEQKNGWGRVHSALIVAQALPLKSEFKQAFTDDAAAVTFKGLSADAFVKLKEGILKLLAK